MLRIAVHRARFANAVESAVHVIQRLTQECMKARMPFQNHEELLQSLQSWGTQFWHHCSGSQTLLKAWWEEVAMGLGHQGVSAPVNLAACVYERWLYRLSLEPWLVCHDSAEGQPGHPVLLPNLGNRVHRLLVDTAADEIWASQDLPPLSAPPPPPRRPQFQTVFEEPALPTIQEESTLFPSAPPTPSMEELGVTSGVTIDIPAHYRSQPPPSRPSTSSYRRPSRRSSSSRRSRRRDDSSDSSSSSSEDDREDHSYRGSSSRRSSHHRSK